MDSILSSVIQFTVVWILTLAIHAIFVKNKKGYLKWIGLYMPDNSSWIKPGLIIGGFSIVIMVTPLVIFIETGLLNKEILETEFTSMGLGVGVIIAILFAAIIKTALTEEILFRGLIGKRIANKYGFLTGNVLQSILFGLPHGLPFILVYDMVLIGVLLCITAGIVGFLEFYLNEKWGNGSLIPSVCVHGLMNLMSFTIQGIS